MSTTHRADRAPRRFDVFKQVKVSTVVARAIERLGDEWQLSQSETMRRLLRQSLEAAGELRPSAARARPRSPQEVPYSAEVRTSVRLTQAQDAAVDRLALDAQSSKSAVLRRLVAEGLRARGVAVDDQA